MDAAELVTRAMKATGDTSIRSFAARLGVTHAAVHHWMQGNNAPSFEVAAEMAELAGLPPVKTAADVRLHSKDGAKHRALLRRLAQAAAIAFVVLALPFTGHAKAPDSPTLTNATYMHYAKSFLRWLARFVRSGVTSITSHPHGTPALLA